MFNLKSEPGQIMVVLGIGCAALGAIIAVGMGASADADTATEPTPAASSTYEPMPEPEETSYDSETKHVEDFTPAQDRAFYLKLQDDIPLLAATVPEDILTSTGRQTAFALSAGVSKEQ